MKKIILLAVITFVVVMIVKMIVPANIAGHAKINGAELSTAQAINDFKLTDNQGHSFSKKDLQGHWTMVFFGFTNCGMVCPTTLAALNQMYQQLAKELPKDVLPKVVMISVDPERDSAARMNEYVKSFNANFIGARGELSQTLAMEKQFHVVAAKMDAEGQGKNHYTVNHSAEIIVMNPEAKIQAYLSYPHDPQRLVKDYKTIIGRS